MPLNQNLIKVTINAGIARGAQVRNEQMLKRYNFFYVETEGCWVREGNRIYTDGANWVFYHPKDATNKPTYHGAGAGDLQNAILECM